MKIPALIAMLILIGGAAPAFGQEPAAAVSVEKLLSAYQDHALSADLRYRDRRVRVTGVIFKIGSRLTLEGTADRQGDGGARPEPAGAASRLSDKIPYVAFRSLTHNGFVRCHFSPAQAEELMKLKKGQNLTITGAVRPGGSGAVVDMDDCVLQ